jgi:hypothetical protein
MYYTTLAFQPGYQRINHPHQVKFYLPYLHRLGQRRYACHGRARFHNATAAQEYAQRWADRAVRIIVVKESGIVS